MTVNCQTLRKALVIQAPLGLAVVCLALAMLSGCASGQKAAPGAKTGPNAPFDQLQLLCAPVTLDFDQTPGPDGFALRVYAVSTRQSKAVPITKGTLEILMFDGLLKGGGPDSPKPLRTWSYTAQELKGYAYKTAIGTSYGLTPLWGDAKPVQSRITVIARYTSPDGGKLRSAPSVISVVAY